MYIYICILRFIKSSLPKILTCLGYPGSDMFNEIQGEYNLLLKITNKCHAWLHECTVHAMRKQINQSSDGGDSGSKNASEAMVGSAFGGSLASGVKRSVLCWCAWQESGVSCREDFSHLIYFIRKFYKCYNFNAICTDNATINCIAVQHKETFILVPLTGHITLYSYLT
jgi:hypothetical protein